MLLNSDAIDYLTVDWFLGWFAAEEEGEERQLLSNALELFRSTSFRFDLDQLWKSSDGPNASLDRLLEYEDRNLRDTIASCRPHCCHGNNPVCRWDFASFGRVQGMQARDLR